MESSCCKGAKLKTIKEGGKVRYYKCRACGTRYKELYEARRAKRKQ